MSSFYYGGSCWYQAKTCLIPRKTIQTNPLLCQLNQGLRRVGTFVFEPKTKLRFLTMMVLWIRRRFCPSFRRIQSGPAGLNWYGERFRNKNDHLFILVMSNQEVPAWGYCCLLRYLLNCQTRCLCPVIASNEKGISHLTLHSNCKSFTSVTSMQLWETFGEWEHRP